MFDLTSFPALVLVLLIFAWLGAITFLLVRLLRTFSRLTKGVSEKDLKSVLDEVINAVKKEDKTAVDLGQKLEGLKTENKNNLQRLGLVRYNPFADTGGNQSFVLAILDGNDSGFVITSLHSRESTRVFAKPVVAGKETGYEFSKEEIQAILEAQKKSRKQLG